MACLEPGMMSSRYLSRRRPARLYIPLPMLSHPVQASDGEVWSRIPRDLHPESEMECLDEVTCRGISCPPRLHTNTTFSLALSPRPHDTLFSLRPTAELLSRPITVLLSILLRQQNPFTTTCNQSVAGRHSNKPSQDAVHTLDPRHSLRRCHRGPSQGRGRL